MSIFPYFPASGVPPSSDEPGQWGVFHESRDAEAQVQLWLQFFLLFFGFFDALEIEWRFEMLTFFLFWRLGDWEILQIFTFSYFLTLLWDWDFDQLAVTDVDGIRTSGTMVRSWKTSSSQSLNGRTGNNGNCCINSSTGISTILSKTFFPASKTHFQQTLEMFVHNVCPSSANKRFLF